MSVAQKAGKAGALLLFRKMWGALVNLAVMAYLARTLDKSDFGLVAISGTLIEFIQTLGISGLGEFVVFYSGDDRHQIRNAAFWLNAALTAAVAVVVLVATPFWANLYGDPRIAHLVWLLLVGFVFGTMSTVPQAIFRKSLDYRPMVAIQTAFGTVSQLSQATLAFLGFGVYSLAIPHAVISPLMSATLLWRSGFRPHWGNAGIKDWRRILGYTKHVIGASILNKFANEGDTLLIGRLLGMEALGIYDIAFKLANIVNTHLLPIITNVSMPVFSHHQTETFVVRRYYLRMVELISIVFVPMIGAMIVFAPGIISLLYGHKWDAAVVPFQILCGFTILRSLSSPTSGLYNALGKPHLGLYFTAAFTPLLLFGLFISSSFGLIWACATVTVLRNLGSMFHFFMARLLLGFTWRELWHTLKAPVCSVVIAACGIAMLGNPSYLAWAIVFGLVFVVAMWSLFRQDSLQRLALIRELTPLAKSKVS